MIEPVALGQTRFNVPGMAADERGVAVGRRLLCLFPDLPRALAFFRSVSRQGSLADLLSSLALDELQAQTGLREVAAAFDVAGSFQADGVAATARAHGAVVFTGFEPHWVPYRDARRPLGLDVADPSAMLVSEEGTALYTEAGADLRRSIQQFSFKDLLLRMQPVALRPAELREIHPDAYVLRLPRGLLPRVRSYLWRRRVRAELCQTRVAATGLFEDRATELTLVRCRELPPGSLALMEGTPGVEVYTTAVEGVLVQRGWRHPVTLEACASLFGPQELICFRGDRRGVERLDGTLHWVALDDVTPITLVDQDAVPLLEPQPEAVLSISALGVQARLIPDPLARGSAEAVLIDTHQLADLQALVHLLPEALWHGCEVAMARPFTVVLSPAGVRALPLGLALAAAHPRVFVPVGMRFSPRLTEDLYVQHFALGGNDQMIFFPPPAVGTPFSISRGDFVPLSRSAVHPEDMEMALDVVTRVPGLNTAGEPVVYHPQGAALRRWDAAAELDNPAPERALGPATTQHNNG